MPPSAITVWALPSSDLQISPTDTPLPAASIAARRPAPPAPLAALTADTANYANVSVIISNFATIANPEPLDLVWTSQNYHDMHDKFMGPADLSVVNRQVFKALKPGGVYLVLDHSAEAGSGLRDTDTLHRIDSAVVKSEVTAAGFIFEGESTVLRNPRDPRSANVYDAAIRGKTDQFLLRFKKPK